MQPVTQKPSQKMGEKKKKVQRGPGTQNISKGVFGKSVSVRDYVCVCERENRRVRASDSESMHAMTMSEVQQLHYEVYV